MLSFRDGLLHQYTQFNTVVLSIYLNGNMRKWHKANNGTTIKTLIQALLLEHSFKKSILQRSSKRITLRFSY